MEFERASRPALPEGKKVRAENLRLYAALEEAAADGGAIQIRPNGEPINRIRNRIMSRFRDMRVRGYVQPDGSYLVWLEKK